MPQNLTQKLFDAHLLEGEPAPGREIGLRIDQTLTQDATGTLVMLELEAMGLDRVQTGLSAQYVAGEEIYQAYVGSSANPGYRDFAVAARIVDGRQVHPRVSFDVNPTSRQLLLNLIRDRHLSTLIASGARLHQAGCNGCIGMGQAPATGKLSLRSVPRNFPGRSGTKDDQVCLVSPETAAASALTGRITRSNIPKIAGFALEAIDDTYFARAQDHCDAGGHIVVGGDNYGQGSSREHAALAPRYLGLRIVIARSFARIHWQNLINFGILPLTFSDPSDYERVSRETRLSVRGLRRLDDNRELTFSESGNGASFRARHDLSPRQVEVVLAGGLINHVRSSS